jgi:hypothetical protein
MRLEWSSSEPQMMQPTRAARGGTERNEAGEPSERDRGDARDVVTDVVVDMVVGTVVDTVVDVADDVG